MSPARMYSTHLRTASSNCGCVKFDWYVELRLAAERRCRPAAASRVGVESLSTSRSTRRQASSYALEARSASRLDPRRPSPAPRRSPSSAHCRTRSCGRRTRTTDRAVRDRRAARSAGSRRSEPCRSRRSRRRRRRTAAAPAAWRRGSLARARASSSSGLSRVEFARDLPSPRVIVTRLAVRFEQQKRLGRQKAVPPHLLAADHALEQARAAAVVDLVKRAHRRQHVAQHAAIDGHVVGRAGQLARRSRSRESVASGATREPVGGLAYRGVAIIVPRATTTTLQSKSPHDRTLRGRRAVHLDTQRPPS